MLLSLPRVLSFPVAQMFEVPAGACVISVLSNLTNWEKKGVNSLGQDKTGNVFSFVFVCF